MNTRTLIEQMVEALEYTKDPDSPHYDDQLTAITAARQWLAAPESEAVLYVATDALEYIAAGGVRIEAVAPCSEIAEDGQFVPLFTHPAPSKPDPLPELTRGELLGAIARGWCTDRNMHKIMDSDLAFDIADSILAAAREKAK